MNFTSRLSSLYKLVSNLRSNPEFAETSRFLVIGVQWLSFCYVIDKYVLHVSITHGPSMMPTLDEMGNLILVDRISPSRLGWAPIARGDIVIASSSYKRDFTVCKRVIALPGDTVRVAPPPSQRHLFDFDRDIPKGVEPKYYDNNNEDEENDEYDNGDDDEDNETKNFNFNNKRAGGYQEGGSFFRKVIVPPGHVWLEGDNPHDSVDSRYYGPVPGALIRGRAIARIWPLTSARWLDRDSCPKPVANTILRDAMLQDPVIISDVKQTLLARKEYLQDELNRSIVMARYLAKKEQQREYSRLLLTGQLNNQSIYSKQTTTLR
jgi:inner membrane protease subunit 1